MSSDFVTEKSRNTKFEETQQTYNVSIMNVASPEFYGDGMF